MRWKNGVILIDNEKSLRIWIVRVLHCYQRGHFVLVASKVQVVPWFASEHCMPPVIVRFELSVR